MFGLEVGTDVSALSGCSLESIDLTEHQVQLRLDTINGITLSIESDFSQLTHHLQVPSRTLLVGYIDGTAAL